MAEMTAAEAAEWGKTLDFPTVWATLTKLDEKMDRRIEEMAANIERLGERVDRVTANVRRMELIRQYPPAETKGKKLIGAMAGAVVTSEAREYAEQNGFFVLELTGNDVCLLEPPENFQPREW
jgi:GTPase